MTRTGIRSVISTLVVAAGLLAVFAQPAAASPGAYRVLFLNGVDGTCTGDTGVQDQLAAMPGVAKVDAFNASTGTPSVAQLDAYDMAVPHSDCDAFKDGTALGNNLADYADHGGVVVEFAFTTEPDPGYELEGRWQTGGYSPYVPGNNVNNDVTLGIFPTTPLMEGVDHLTSSCNTDPTLAPGATRIATWDNGQEAVAVKGQAVAVTASIDDSGCEWGGNYARLTLNAVTLLDKHGPSGTAISKAAINRKKRKARFEFSAPGTITGFECALTRKKPKKKGKKAAAPFGSCASPKIYKKLRPGKYTFQVRATNQFGTDSQPATRKFKI